MLVIPQDQEEEIRMCLDATVTGARWKKVACAQLHGCLVQ
jgi:hypothetical protein